MGDERLQELARQYARDEIPVDTYRAERTKLLDSLTAGASAQRTIQPGHDAEPDEPWLDWLPLGVAGLALASTLFWILA